MWRFIWKCAAEKKSEWERERKKKEIEAGTDFLV
jgi:hypothetical protein